MVSPEKLLLTEKLLEFKTLRGKWMAAIAEWMVILIPLSGLCIFSKSRFLFLGAVDCLIHSIKL
jgi:hypothetical protein